MVMKFKTLSKLIGLVTRRAEPSRPTFEQTMDQHGWMVVARNDIYSHHIIPVNDQGVHKVDNRCWCNPELDDSNNWVHNAQDGRSEYENGRLLQ